MNTNIILAQADSVSIPLPDESTNVICCSPPYYRARHYEPEIHTSWPQVDYSSAPGERLRAIAPWVGPLGWEPTHWAFVGHLVYIFRGLHRVLRPHGVAWVVIGDKYVGSDEVKLNIGAKGSMLAIPHLLGSALSTEGWLWRADVVWSKVSSCVPESVQGWRWTDRKCACARNPRAAEHLKLSTSERPRSTMTPADPDPNCPICGGAGVLPGQQLIRGSWRHTRAHEYVLQLAKNRQYFCDHTQAWEPAVSKDKTWRGAIAKGEVEGTRRDRVRTNLTVRAHRNPRSVVSPRSYYYLGSHTAPYNPDLIGPLIRASCPKHTCTKCGVPWAPVIHRGVVTEYRAVCKHQGGDTIPGTVLDPFAGCFDEQTEILTKNGWKTFPDLVWDDLVCSLDPNTNTIEYIGFTRYFKYKYHGDMFRVEGRSIDLLVTPNHKIYAKEYHHENFALYTMRDFTYENFHKLNQGIWRSNKEESPDLLRFLGFWYGDGYKSKSKRNRVGFNLQKERKCMFLESLLHNLNVEYRKYIYGPRKTYHINNKEICNVVEGNTYTKRVPKYIFDLSISSIGYFLEGFIMADGDTRDTLYSCNKGLIDDLQVLALLSGRSGSVRVRPPREGARIKGRLIQSKYPSYVLHLYVRDKYMKLSYNRNVSVEPYDGYVYDVMLERNHVLYIRRNGKPCWSGNSGTTGVVCRELGFNFIGLDLSYGYLRDQAQLRIHKKAPRGSWDGLPLFDTLGEYESV